MYGGSDTVCNTHNRQVFQFCVHPMCHGLKPLCKICFEEHEQYHEKRKKNVQIQKTCQEPDPQKIFRTLNEVQNEVRQTLNEIRDILEQLEDKAYVELNLDIDPEASIQSIISELEEIKQNINHEMNEFIKKLKESFEKPIKDKILKVYEEIKTKRDTIQAMLEDCEGMETIKKTMLSDLFVQTITQRNQLDNLINQRKINKFQGKIDDDVALRFQGTFKKELDNLIKFDKDLEQSGTVTQKPDKIKLVSPYSVTQPNTYEQKKMFQATQIHSHIVSNFALTRSINPNANTLNNQVWSQNIHNSLFFFEEGTKNIHVYDIINKEYQCLPVQMDFNFYPGHRSLLGPDGNIYIFGGYDKNINEENEDLYKQIHQLVISPQEQQLKLKKDSNLKLDTVRKHFGVCVVQNEIFIVGGFNYREGTLKKCEKIVFQEKNSRNQRKHTVRLGGEHRPISRPNEIGQEQFDIRVQQINILNYKCSHSAITSFRDKYIFKFGGQEYNTKMYEPKGKTKFSNYIEIYTIELDHWDEVNISYEYSIENFINGNALQINPQYILIFGGVDIQEKPTKQTYLLKIQEDKVDDQTDNFQFNLSLELDLGTLSLPQEGFCQQNCIIVNKCLYSQVLTKYNNSVNKDKNNNQQNNSDEHRLLMNNNSYSDRKDQQDDDEFNNNGNGLHKFDTIYSYKSNQWKKIV